VRPLTFHGRRAARQKSARCRAIDASAAAAWPPLLLASAALAATAAALRHSLTTARRAAASCSCPAACKAAALWRDSTLWSRRGSGTAPPPALHERSNVACSMVG